MTARSDWRFVVLGASAAVISAMVASTAGAQSTAPTSIMKACWVEGSGVVYRRDTTGAPTGCQQATHRAIEWTLGLVPVPPGGLTAVPVPLNLSGTQTGAILNLSNSGSGQALIATASGTSATALFQRGVGTGYTVRMTNTATGSGFNSVLRVEQSADNVASDFQSTGTGGAINAASTSPNQATVVARNNATTGGIALSATSQGTFSTVDLLNTGTGGAIAARSASPQQATIFASNTSTTTGSALFADAKGTTPTGDFRNTGTANGVALNARSNGTAASIYSDATGGASAIYAESKGQWQTLDLRNTGTANGNAMSARSNTTGCNVCLQNDNTGTGSGLYVEAKGTREAVGINNISGGGGALNAFSNASFTTAYFGNDATSGNSRAVFANSKGGSPTITASNTGTANGAAIQGMSQGQNYTGDFRNTGNGGSVYALSQGGSNTIIGSNTGSNGGAASFDNASSTANTVSIVANGGATALFARSSSQNGVWFDNIGTGNNIGILGTSNGVWPTAQFENRAGGPALRAVGSATIVGNLRIEGNYVATGTKNAVVPTSTGTREMYTEEATEVWFADYGQATLSDSVVWVPFDGTFAETIESDRPYHVFLQAYGDASIYVSRRTADGFEVRVRGDRSTVQPLDFSYRLVAKRRGYGDRRLKAHPLDEPTSTGKVGAGK